MSSEQSGVSQIRTAGVDLGGLMTVLGRHLYSTPVVALRELVQNAHDSIIRRRIENKGWNGESRISISGDHVNGIIRVIDTGAGLTENEIHTYLATVGVGYTRTLRENYDESGLIGMFGLGFLSAFVLADEVKVTTTSYQTPEEGWRYLSTNGERYSVTPVPSRDIGTEVELHLREEFMHLSSDEVLRRILTHYCVLLHEPVYIGAGSADAVNPEAPPWREKEGNTLEHPVWLQRKRMDFARRFESMFEPLCTIPVVPNEQRRPNESDAKGLLWIQDGGTYGTSDNRQLCVFGRGMLLDDDARDLLPAWAGFISGVIESNYLTPTASREDLQKDDLYYSTQGALSEALITGLANVAKTQPEAWRRVLYRHNEALLGAALCDDRLFALLANDVRIPTSQGDLPARSLKTDKGLMHVMLGAQGGFEDMLFRVLKVPVARGDRYAVLPFMRKWVQIFGGNLVELGTEQGNRKLFATESLSETEQAWLTDNLAHGELVVPARFAPAELPLVVVPDRDAELKRRLEEDETDKRISVAALRLARNYTAKIDGSVISRLYLNLENKAVQRLLADYRSGKDCYSRAILLRSLKVIMAANDENNMDIDLNTALGDLCDIIANKEII